MNPNKFLISATSVLVSLSFSANTRATTSSLGSKSGIYDNGNLDVVARPDGSLLVAHSDGATIATGTPNHEILFDLNTNQPAGTFLKDIKITGSIKTTAISPDGSVYLGGSSFNPDTSKPGVLYKVNSNGTADQSFQPPVFPTTVSVVTVETDGTDNIWVAGSGYLFKLSSKGTVLAQTSTVDFSPEAVLPSLSPVGSVIIAGQGGVKKVLANGAIDPTFNLNLDFKTIYPYGLTRVSDGILVTEREGQSSKFGLVKINDAGAVDSTFSSGQGFDGGVYGVVPSTDNSGSIYVAGRFSNYDGTPAPSRTVRISHDGLLDLSFAPALTNDYLPVGLSLNPKGQLLSFGELNSNRNDHYFQYAIIDQSGKVLSTQTKANYFSDYSVQLFQQLKDGRILLTGDLNIVYYQVAGQGLAILNPDGSLNLDIPGKVNSIQGIPGQPDKNLIQIGYQWSILLSTQLKPINIYSGNLIALENGGYVSEDRGTLTMLGPDLAPLQSFKMKDPLQDSGNIWLAPILGDPSRVWVSGQFSMIGNKKVGSLLQFNGEGKIEKNFGFKGGSAIATSSDFKTVWAENAFRKNNGDDEFNFIRYTPSGDKQAQFNAMDACASVTNSSKVNPRSYTPANDGSVYVTVNCTPKGENYSQQVIARFTADGQLDKDFHFAKTPYPYSIYGYSLVSDGSGDFVIYGSFTTYEGEPRYGIARIHKDGTLAK